MDVPSADDGRLPSATPRDITGPTVAVPAAVAYHFHSKGKEIGGPPGYGVDFQMPSGRTIRSGSTATSSRSLHSPSTSFSSRMRSGLCVCHMAFGTGLPEVFLSGVFFLRSVLYSMKEKRGDALRLVVHLRDEFMH
jgi:hypothetical protein